MIEFVMIFTLGALAAILLALSALPALDRRAQRLARRRLEALFPMSIAEIAAERDHVRAAMAVDARRAEVKAEATAREKALDLAEIGRRDKAIHDLNKILAERDAGLAGAAEQVALLSARLSETESGLAEANHALAAHQELGGGPDAREQAQAEGKRALDAAEEKLSATQRRLNETIEANAALQLELRGAVGLAAERQLAIATLDAQLETALGEARDATRQLAAARDLLGQYAATIAALTAVQPRTADRATPTAANSDEPPADSRKASSSDAAHRPASRNRSRRRRRKLPPAAE